MNLQEQIEKDFLSAYKAKEEVRVAVLRMLKTAIKNRQVELLRPLTDEEILEVIGRQVKQRLESIEQFRQGGRAAMAEREEAELAVLKAYMPTQLTPEETAAAVDAAIAETGASGPKEMGKVMQAVMARFKGRIDGKAVSEIVKARLSS
ncbi:GatB/YqeY domain-containing protein [Fundidesulfovibrio agrisoli]|uniref:GatB/YqeY domain-containing protein n=1 Tax=Fundidesulfovibrio agrisoli TaxID=2922717 RepID=UPI001FAD9DD2|nr:GatB/YqeY domain-containing protein [Fundidesulfovibrio agrisoli]